MKQFSSHWKCEVFAAMCAASLALGCGAAVASDDHDRARQALEAGEVLPLRTILERVDREYPGQVVDVELERERENSQERWVYKLKVLRSGGSLVKLKVDARDGTVIGKRGPGEHKRDQQKTRHGGEGN
ncbi:MAG: hypothetical protein AW09_003115 [Candidatus Accumulibacter phosphatis]|jgi:hypothetical protein|uniref:PepSY domain-containing protein n=3 Tax=Candidatus Accumulibacter TaxID=327159 RepID=A0A080M3K5_9PROT|nr:MAG: hypothetical protein AW09_003115 [Candidatus Accumulibacter phosphatis]MBL8407206.1 PepSY domain-containing protein [Accumulibacter sp.]NMQ06583.1 hypothetical protein [Candidatus Accumulibacter contiguus]HRF12407.1 PepSY domain-containing protein [Candidatus Accumulibacter phosphatis]